MEGTQFSLLTPIGIVQVADKVRFYTHTAKVVTGWALVRSLGVILFLLWHSGCELQTDPLFSEVFESNADHFMVNSS